MNAELLTILEYIEQERGISRDVLIDAVEKALLSASRKSIHPASELTVKMDTSSGDIKAWAKLEVVESLPNNDQLLLERARERMPDVKVGDVVDWEVTPSNFGRIAAQTAKQAIMQQLRKAEKDIVRDEFSSQVGTLINGTVRRFENGGIIIDFQKTEGIMSFKEKIPGEQYMPGDRITALLLKVDDHGSGPSLIVSRSHVDFVRRLFEREVSEIHDGTVEIVAIAREPGSRSKVSVKSNDSRVDPVGACVGMRGIRVKSITGELGGERVDIIPYDEDIRKYAANALQPAKVNSVTADEEQKALTIHVAPAQSRLAFGRKAQNVRLSSKLLGWSFNIEIDEPKVEESIEEKIKKAVSSLAGHLDISEESAALLVNNGYLSLDGLKEAGAEQLRSIEGINSGDTEKIIAAIS